MLAALLLLGACAAKKDSGSTDSGAQPQAEANVVEVGITEYAFGMPAEITGGMVTLEFTNKGELPHETAFGSIEGDHDLDDVMKALNSQKPPTWFKDLGGVPVLEPGATASMTRELAPGRYILLCFFPTPGSGKPHVMEGMVQIFDAVGTSDAVAPETDLTVTATDKGFDVPQLSEGTHTIEFTNEGSKPHEFAVYSFNEGMTEKDINKWFESGFKSAQPAVFPGGMQSIDPGTTVWVEMSFEGGRTYLVEDFEGKLRSEIEVS
jgi:hypothetical protein